MAEFFAHLAANYGPFVATLLVCVGVMGWWIKGMIDRMTKTSLDREEYLHKRLDDVQRDRAKEQSEYRERLIAVIEKNNEVIKEWTTTVGKLMLRPCMADSPSKAPKAKAKAKAKK